jgi:hypothetical protein
LFDIKHGSKEISRELRLELSASSGDQRKTQGTVLPGTWNAARGIMCSSTRESVLKKPACASRLASLDFFARTIKEGGYAEIYFQLPAI